MDLIDKTNPQSISLRITKFDGKAKHWKHFKSQVRCYLRTKGLKELLDESNKLYADKEKLPADKNQQALANKVQEQNSYAFSVLLKLIDYNTTEGEEVYNDIEGLMHDGTGFEFGNYREAMKMLTDQFESQDVPVLSE